MHSSLSPIAIVLLSSAALPAAAPPQVTVGPQITLAGPGPYVETSIAASTTNPDEFMAAVINGEPGTIGRTISYFISTDAGQSVIAGTFAPDWSCAAGPESYADPSVAAAPDSGDMWLSRTPSSAWTPSSSPSRTSNPARPAWTQPCSRCAESAH